MKPEYAPPFDNCFQEIKDLKSENQELKKLLESAFPIFQDLRQTGVI
jgi:hypothetical protein